MLHRRGFTAIGVGVAALAALALLSQQAFGNSAPGDHTAMAMDMATARQMHFSVSHCSASGCKTLALVRRGNGYVAVNAPARATQPVMIMNFAFAPQNLTINVGDTVTWTNMDSAAHTVTSDPGSAELSSGSLAQNQSYSHTFNSAGTFKYHCDFHPNMVASIIVQAAGSTAATATPAPATNTAAPAATPVATAAPAATTAPTTAPTAVPASNTASVAAPITLQAGLSGANEVDAQGAPNKGSATGSGTATVTLIPSSNQICFTIAVTNVTLPAAAAHIHLGAAGTNGNVVVPFTAPDASGMASGCAGNVDPALLSAIAANPANYYVNVHTSDFPAGAVRGQLSASVTLGAMLNGVNEVDAQGAPNKGSTTGSGMATVTLNPALNQVCYRIAVANITLPATAAHIHNALAGTNGNVVVPFTAPDANGIASGCVNNVAPGLIATLTSNPTSYYVNVHTSDFPAGAVRGQLSPAVSLQAMLSGANEVDAQGAPNKGSATGSGMATVTLIPSLNQICYVITATQITLPAAAAHIHSASAGSNGNVVVPFTAPGANGMSGGCVSNVDAALLAAITANPANYYVNVHTSDFPAGAVRGQLFSASAPMTFQTKLSGANEVDAQGAPNKGSATGSGTATVTLIPSSNQICFTIAVTNVTLPAAAAHIHLGAAGTNGNVVVPFTAPDASGMASGCAGNVDPALLSAIAANPANYYVNVHTSDFPAGAVRGQLSTTAGQPVAAATATTMVGTQTPLPTSASGTTPTAAETATTGGTTTAEATATVQATAVTTGTIDIHNAPRTVTGGRTTPCDLQQNLQKLQPGCIIVSSVSVPGASVTYVLTYPGVGKSQSFDDTADSRGHSLHIFNVAYLPPAGATHGSASTIVKVTVGGSPPGSGATPFDPAGTRFVVVR